MNIPDSVTRTFSRQLLKLRKQSPHILFGTGVVGVLAGTVLACRATLRAEPVLTEMESDIAWMKANRDRRVAEDGYTDREYQKDMAYVYTKHSLRLARLYAPAATVTIASIGALTGSHVTMTRRNNALMATVNVVTNAYAEYRERVRKEIGEDRELELYYNVGKETIVDENGKKREIAVPDPTKFSIHARFFDEGSIYWKKNPELNRLFVQTQQNYANDLLHARGHVFLNEVYDMLGIERSAAGQVVGWILGNGANFIDFGMFDGRSREFINGNERTILLDFNVDGQILNLL